MLGVLCGVGCSPFVVPPSREILCLMLPFAFSLGLPLLAGVNTPTWSLVSWTIQRPGTDEAAGLLLPGTWLVVEALPPTNPAPPWWMLCGWTGSPRSPEPAAAGVAACYFDDRYQKFGDTGAGAATAWRCFTECRMGTYRPMHEGVSVERPLHSCMPCSFRCSLYL